MPLPHAQPVSEGPKPSHWMAEMGQSFRRLPELLDFLQLDPETAPFTLAETDEFPFLVTHPFASKMAKGDWFDPLLAQVLPLEKERQVAPGFLLDAVGDGKAQCAPGLLHKYANRVLFMPTSLCAIHCRYCFRRHFGYSDLPKTQDSWQPAWDYLSGPEGQAVEEVILSGGDPLSLDNKRLEVFFEKIKKLRQVKTIRLHSRLPIVLPSRLDTGFLELMAKSVSYMSLVMVVHSNHAQEWDSTVTEAVRKLQTAGVLVLNQSVLLKGVNDSIQALSDLSQALLRAGVLPYYLHLLDRVQGVGHFEVDEDTAKGLMEGLRQRLQGYAVPKLVREIPGEPYKTWLPL